MYVKEYMLVWIRRLAAGAQRVHAGLNPSSHRRCATPRQYPPITSPTTIPNESLQLVGSDDRAPARPGTPSPFPYNKAYHQLPSNFAYVRNRSIFRWSTTTSGPLKPSSSEHTGRDVVVFSVVSCTGKVSLPEGTVPQNSDEICVAVVQDFAHTHSSM
jgi:hypothetical protein